MKYEIDLIPGIGEVTIKLAPGVYCTDAPETKSWEEHKPWIDWQENSPDNKPHEGIECLIKTDKCIDLCKFMGGGWKDDSGFWFDYLVTKWAYIPE